MEICGDIEDGFKLGLPHYWKNAGIEATLHKIGKCVKEKIHKIAPWFPDGELSVTSTDIEGQLEGVRTHLPTVGYKNDPTSTRKNQKPRGGSQQTMDRSVGNQLRFLRFNVIRIAGDA